jgi:ribosome-associated protein
VSPLQTAVAAALDDMKAVNVKMLDIRGVSDFADTMIVASGNSDRHVRSIADRVVEKAKAAGVRPLGVEGARDGEWVLVDLNDVIVHVMLPRVREFYGLERLWETDAPAAVAATPPTRIMPAGSPTLSNYCCSRSSPARGARGAPCSRPSMPRPASSRALCARANISLRSMSTAMSPRRAS